MRHIRSAYVSNRRSARWAQSSEHIGSTRGIDSFLFSGNLLGVGAISGKVAFFEPSSKSV